jgi:quercetin dioxygenase-like cupin family protein
MPQTTHQPAGEYPHPSPAHHLDLDEVATQLLSRLPGQGRQTRNIARESGVSLLVMALEQGNSLPEHSADGVVLVQVLRGHTYLEAAGQSLDLRPGQVLMFQPGVRHDIRAVEQSVVLLTITGGS